MMPTLCHELHAYFPKKETQFGEKNLQQSPFKGQMNSGVRLNSLHFSKICCVLEHSMLLNMEKTTNIMLACCILHNIVKEREGVLRDVHEELLDATVDD